MSGITPESPDGGLGTLASQGEVVESATETLPPGLADIIKDFHRFTDGVKELAASMEIINGMAGQLSQRLDGLEGTVVSHEKVAKGLNE